MLDKFDLDILAFMQANNQTSQRHIGDQIGLSAAAVQRRVKRLREDGFIAADISVIDRNLTGSQITIIVEIFLVSEEIELIDQMKKAFKETPEIQQCYYVTGESDFFLIVVVPTMSEYEKLTRRVFFSNVNIKRFRTVVAMGLEKIGLDIPLQYLVQQL